MNSLYYVVFDGTTSFVCSFDEVTSDMEIIHHSNDFDRCCEISDEYNETI